MVQFVRPLQFRNPLSPIDVTLSGISILVRLLQPLKASPPIVVTPFPMVQLVRLLHR